MITLLNVNNNIYNIQKICITEIHLLSTIILKIFLNSQQTHVRTKKIYLKLLWLSLSKYYIENNKIGSGDLSRIYHRHCGWSFVGKNVSASKGWWSRAGCDPAPGRGPGPPLPVVSDHRTRLRYYPSFLSANARLFLGYIDLFIFFAARASWALPCDVT